MENFTLKVLEKFKYVFLLCYFFSLLFMGDSTTLELRQFFARQEKQPQKITIQLIQKRDTHKMHEPNEGNETTRMKPFLAISFYL